MLSIRTNRFPMSDHILNFWQLHSESLATKWDHFKGCLKSTLDHDISVSSLVESFYQALNSEQQAHADDLMGEDYLAFLRSSLIEVVKRLDKLEALYCIYIPYKSKQLVSWKTLMSTLSKCIMRETGSSQHTNSVNEAGVQKLKACLPSWLKELMHKKTC